MIASTASSHGHATRDSASDASAISVTRMSLLVCAASASSNALLELASAPPLVPDDEHVDDERRDDDATSTSPTRCGARCAIERADAFAQQLEARDRQKADDAERAERLELVVAVRMVFVRRARGDGNEHHADHVVQHVEPRLERGAEHGQRARAHSDDDLDRGDERVEREDDSQRAPNAGRARAMCLAPARAAD